MARSTLYSGDIDKCAFQMMALISRVTDLINLVLSGARFINGTQLAFRLSRIRKRKPQWIDLWIRILLSKVAGALESSQQRPHGLSQCVLRSRKGTHCIARTPCESQDAKYQTRLRILEDAHVEMAKLALSNAAAARCRGAPESSLARLTTRCSVLDGQVDLQTIHAQLVDIIREELSSLPSTSFESKTLDRLTLSNMDCNGVVA